MPDGTMPSATPSCTSTTTINNGEYRIDWHDNWWGADIFAFSADVVKQAVNDALHAV